MWVLRVCFWTKVLKQMWHWKGRILVWISMWRFRFAERVNSREHTSHLYSFIPCEKRTNKSVKTIWFVYCLKGLAYYTFYQLFSVCWITEVGKRHGNGIIADMDIDSIDAVYVHQVWNFWCLGNERHGSTISSIISCCKKMFRGAISICT